MALDARQAPRWGRLLSDATNAFAAERYSDARRALRILLAGAPDLVSARELSGLLWYRTGRWNAALKDLEWVRSSYQGARSSSSTDAFELHAVLADCYRALRNYAQAARLWEELREMSPSAEAMAEGRIVMAHTLADQGKLGEAIDLLSKVRRPNRVPQTYHLRSWYALADLYERSGDVASARTVFERVAAHDPELADVVDRLASL